MDKTWIGVDLDGTLARYDGYKGVEHVGEPIPLMVALVKAFLTLGIDVRIFTARAAYGPDAISPVIKWTIDVFGRALPVTNEKDFDMAFCIDDRAVSVKKNTGEPLVDLLPFVQEMFFHNDPRNPDNPNYVADRI